MEKKCNSIKNFKAGKQGREVGVTSGKRNNIFTGGDEDTRPVINERTPSNTT